jgi:hypothetical protein
VQAGIKREHDDWERSSPPVRGGGSVDSRNLSMDRRDASARGSDRNWGDKKPGTHGGHFQGGAPGMFVVLRWWCWCWFDVFFKNKSGQNCYKCGNPGHLPQECQGSKRTNGPCRMHSLASASLSYSVVWLTFSKRHGFSNPVPFHRVAAPMVPPAATPTKLKGGGLCRHCSALRPVA